jgi:hypothetical protein
MSSELRKIRDNLIDKKSSQDEQTLTLLTISMIRFLLDHLKFFMPISSKDFAFQTLSSKLFQRSGIMIRSVNDVLCRMDGL